MHKITHKETFINYPCLSVIEQKLNAAAKDRAVPIFQQDLFSHQVPRNDFLSYQPALPLSIEISSQQRCECSIFSNQEPVTKDTFPCNEFLLCSVLIRVNKEGNLI